MARNRLYKLLSHIANIRPGEEYIGSLLFLYFFLITAPYSIIKSKRNAVFLDMLGADLLPVAYLATAVLIGFIVAFHSKIQIKVSRQFLILGSLAFFVLSGSLFLIPFPESWKWVALIYWLWANVYIVVLITQFFIIVNDIFNPREAKRLIGFFGSGGILGGVVGGFMAGLLAKTLGNSLLLVALVMLSIAMLVVRSIFKRIWQPPEVPPEKEGKRIRASERQAWGFLECFRTVKKSRYLIILASIMAVTLIVSTLIDFQFQSVVASAKKGEANLTAFFGYFNSGILVFSFFLQLLATSNLIQRYGIRFSLQLYPLVLMLGSVGIALYAGIPTAVLIKGGDKGLNLSINQSVRELLYIPVSIEEKYKAKIFIDMFINRFAKGIGAVILLLLAAVGIQELRVVSLVSALIILGWIFLNFLASKEYTLAVKSKLDMNWQRGDQVVASKIDVDNIKLVFDALESKGKSSVLYNMHLFDLLMQEKLSPDIRELLFSASDEAKLSTLGTFFEDMSLTPDADLLDEEILRKEVKEIMSLDVYQDVMKNYFQDVISSHKDDSEIRKMEIAKGIGMMDKDSDLVKELGPLLRDTSPQVVRYAAESAAKLGKREYVPLIIEKLQNPQNRFDSKNSLQMFGNRIVGMLSDYLTDPEENDDLRREVIDILTQISNQEVVDILLMVLREDKGFMKDQLVDSLDKIRAENSEVNFQDVLVKTLIEEEFKNYYAAVYAAAETTGDPETALKEKDFRHKESVFLMNIFKLLGLIYTHDEILNAYQNIVTGTKDSVAYATELLDNILPKEIKDVLIPLLEDSSPAKKAKRAQLVLRDFPPLDKTDE